MLGRVQLICHNSVWGCVSVPLREDGKCESMRLYVGFNVHGGQRTSGDCGQENIFTEFKIGDLAFMSL